VRTIAKRDVAIGGRLMFVLKRMFEHRLVAIAEA